ncbi:RNA polymerase sigma factor [Paenibacillus shunpengii]|uniref:RNA polymerase sigma factor n=1 Tax=Paenibacillus shunpengii TaxID=2054424 RepID=A0ABW5SK12_9BACL|nr:RNA polymerase sigma factor [Paenibacillus sp. PDC88]SDW35176.1 RNA polymerase sigma-70 factor, ECF subfamily [Paenibacillus sp. PDC88]
MVTDEQLARKISEGDQEAFEVMVVRFHGPLLQYAFRLLRDRERAKDAVQETFIKLIRHLRDKGELKHVKAWLYRVLINQCRDYWVSESAVLEALVREQLPEQVDPHVNAEEQFLQWETSNEMRILLYELTYTQQQVVMLRFYEDMKLKDIAELLDLTPSTVKSRLYSGLHRLKAKILDKPYLLAGLSYPLTDTLKEGEMGLGSDTRSIRSINGIQQAVRVEEMV